MKKVKNQIGNSNKDIATAKVGDFIVRDNGDVVVLNQGDIDYAKGKIAEEKQSQHEYSITTSEQKDEIINITPQYHTTYVTTPRIEYIEDELEKMNAEENTNKSESDIEVKNYVCDNKEKINIKTKVNKIKQKNSFHFGLSTSIFSILGLSFDIGFMFSKEHGWDCYRTVGIGCGVGFSGNVTGGVGYSDSDISKLHNSTSKTAVIGALVNTSYDLDNNAKLSEIGGIGFGGGVLWTYTRTLKGDIQDIKNFMERF